jgi:hypothetical protein
MLYVFNMTAMTLMFNISHQRPLYQRCWEVGNAGRRADMKFTQSFIILSVIQMALEGDGAETDILVQ